MMFTQHATSVDGLHVCVKVMAEGSRKVAWRDSADLLVAVAMIAVRSPIG